jgi:hypothetical protein
MMAADQWAALDRLDACWGDDYDLVGTPAGWVAKRLDNGLALVAANPGKLHMLIAADSGASSIQGARAESPGGPT